MNYWLLIGILIIVVGFILKLDAIAVVLVAAIVTALIGGMNFIEIITTLGEQFVSARYMSLFFLTLPVIGISERYGLRERAITLIKGMKSVTSGRLLTIYLLIREVSAAMSLRLGGHPQFIRPLIEPMAQGAAEKEGAIDEALKDEIKGFAASAENYGNFFGQNLFYASSGVLLIVGNLQDYNVEAGQIVLYSLPIAVIAFVVAGVQFYFLDRKIKKAQEKGAQK